MVKKCLKVIIIFYIFCVAGKALTEGIGRIPDFMEIFAEDDDGDYGSRYISVSDEWNLIVVNRWNKIPEGYDVTLTELSNGQQIDSRIYPYLQEMFDDMRAEGIYPIVREGYRTEEEQQKTFDEKVQAYRNEGYSRKRAEKAAKAVVAIPGTSEHQLGIAVDINADKERSDNEEVYAWLAENAHRYGFILRYPQGKEDITGTSYEPWHYRYVGAEAAENIFKDNICLEEYFLQ
ncbi:MAG: M15 family metallopeptidase [Butyrivibrio sp.]|nr:M15 family metallopeptidase [Butyrivibrio sp.]